MRLFFAADLPEPTRDAIAAVTAKLPRVATARWTPKQNYHLTLRFFGECGVETLDALREGLAGLGPPPASELTFRGPRYFPHSRAPRVLIVVAEAPPTLFAYQREVEQLARQAGLDAERRPYIPHVTLARFRPGAREAARFVETAADVDGAWATAAITTASLIESRLRAEGAEYRTIKRYA